LRCQGRAAWAHAKYVFKKRRDVPAGHGFSCASMDPSVSPVACTGGKLRHARPQLQTDRSGELRALAAGSASRPSLSAKGPRMGSYQERPSSPSGVSPLLTSPCPARCRDKSGARRIFAAVASYRGRIEIASGARRDAPDEFFIPTFRYRRSPVRPNVPVGAVPAVG
jgi:hypothetical protein